MSNFIHNLFLKLDRRGHAAAQQRGLQGAKREKSRASDIYVRLENGYGIITCERQGRVFCVDGTRKEDSSCAN